MRHSVFANLRAHWSIISLVALLALALVGVAAHAELSSAPVLTSRPALPLFFEAGPGRSAGAENFLARGQNFQFNIASDRVQFLLSKPAVGSAPQSVSRDEARHLSPGSARLVQMSFLSANASARLSGTHELEGKANYLIGNDPSQWRSGVSLFGGVRVEDLYPGIDLTYYGNQNQLEYDFVVAPQADPSKITLRFDAVDKLTISPEGELTLKLADAELHQHRPVIYQVIKGVRHEVSGGYALQDARTARFDLGPYDREWPLIIDPVFTYSSYFGGNAGDTALAIKVDKAGSVYVAGETLSTKFPAALNSPFQGQFHGGTQNGDAFVAKLDNTGSKLIYFTYIGGSTDDGAYDMAIDSAGDAFVTGFTVSGDFPTKNALFAHINGSPDPKFGVYPSEAFVAELNPSGSALVFSTYLGGTSADVASSIALDPSGYIYVTGLTYSTNFPVVNAIQTSLAGNDDAFVAKFAPGGTRLVYSTYLGGISIDEGEGIAADSLGYAYVSGYTASTNFPITAGAYRSNLNGSGVAVTVYDAFVTKLPPNGRGLTYSTYLGGTQNDYGYRIALDGSGNVFLTGTTQSADFPHTNLFGLRLGNNGTNAVNFDAFLTKLDSRGFPIYTAQFGGTNNDAGWDVAVDPAGRPFVVGITLSGDFPAVAPFDLFRSSNAGGKDVFVVAFNTNASPVLYSGYLGGAGDDYGYGIAVDGEANAYITGMTLSSAFPRKPGAFQSALNGSSDAFVAKIRLFDPMLAVEAVGADFVVSWPATAPDYMLQSTADLVPPQVWTTVSQTPILANGEYSLTVASTNSTTLFRLVRP